MIVTEKEAIKLLDEGNVIGVATDTVYGLAVNEENIKKLFDIKKRPMEKKIVRMVSSIDYFSKLDEKLKKSMEKNWPGAVTYIFEINGTFESFRIPNEPNLLSLLNKYQKPLYVTSANISGEVECKTKDEFKKKFPTLPLLKEVKEINKSNEPSRIYKYEDGKFIQIR